jgi:hypothetical protein
MSDERKGAILAAPGERVKGCGSGARSARYGPVRISGFSFVRNAIDLYYPVVESIRSALPICDEFVVAAGDSSDATTELLRSIEDPKLRIIETVWDQSQFVKGASNAVQTNIALNACSGDWCFYLQADEVVHEEDLGPLVERLRAYQDDPRVDGLLFEYLHFYADYDHVQTGHSWYRREVRVVRGGQGIRSWKSAQGFRRAGRGSPEVGHQEGIAAGPDPVHPLGVAVHRGQGQEGPEKLQVRRLAGLHQEGALPLAVPPGRRQEAMFLQGRQGPVNELAGALRLDGADPGGGVPGVAHFNLRQSRQDQSAHLVIDLPMDIRPFDGGAVLAAVDEGPAHQEIRRVLHGGVPEEQNRGQSAGPGKEQFVKGRGVFGIRRPHVAASGDEQHPDLGVLDALPAEVAVVLAHHGLELREGGDDLGKQVRGAGSQGGAGEAQAVAAQDGGPAHPGQDYGRRVIGEDGPHHAIGGFALHVGNFHGHGPQVLHGQIHFHAGDAAGRAHVLACRLHQLFPAGGQPPGQFLQ